MSKTMTPTVAALRTRSALGSSFTPPAGIATWRDQLPSLGDPAGMRDESAFRSLHPTHNSIPAVVRSTVVLMADLTPADARRGVYGAAKQAAPPRGVPR